MHTDNKFVTLEGAAGLAGCHKETVRRAIDRGDLTAYKRAANRLQVLLLRSDVETWTKPRPVEVRP